MKKLICFLFFLSFLNISLIKCSCNKMPNGNYWCSDCSLGCMQCPEEGKCYCSNGQCGD